MPTKQQLEIEFDAKRQELIAGLKEWYAAETAPIDAELAAVAPGGEGGSILDRDLAIDSKRVLDATLVTEEVLDMELPPELIRPGGYDDFEELIADIVPKLREVFIGERIVRPAKQSITV